MFNYRKERKVPLMDVKEYTQFVIERSTLRYADIDFSMLRAACGLTAERAELRAEMELSTSTVESLLSEAGDVAFWATALKYWIEKAGLALVQNNCPADIEGESYICDAVEKYTRKNDLAKLQDLYDRVCYALVDLPQSVIDNNVAKLTANPRGITNAA
jgi:NTP pyrophosphatase (non-canonical NTP hydrolase)